VDQVAFEGLGGQGARALGGWGGWGSRLPMVREYIGNVEAWGCDGRWAGMSGYHRT
jgi:hypothetical protein